MILVERRPQILSLDDVLLGLDVGTEAVVPPGLEPVQQDEAAGQGRRVVVGGVRAGDLGGGLWCVLRRLSGEADLSLGFSADLVAEVRAAGKVRRTTLLTLMDI